MTLWHAREHARFATGDYKRLAWESMGFWQSNPAIHENLFAHISNNDARLIAYTESDDKGARDIQSVIKPGRFLKKYFGHILSQSEIDRLVRIYNGADSTDSNELPEFTLKFAVTADEIESVYVNGPTSCMSKSIDAEYESDVHPVRVYGDSDLRVAYIESRGAGEKLLADKTIIARALIWPERKIYSRVYPTPSAYVGDERALAETQTKTLINLLESAGYTFGRPNGARIHRIQHNDKAVVLPYLDGSLNAEIHDNNFLSLCFDDSHYSGSNTNGVSIFVDYIGFTCNYCDESIPESESVTVYINRLDTRQYCEFCAQGNTFYCEGLEERYSNDVDYEDINGHIYSIYYIRDNFEQCNSCDSWADNTIKVKYRANGIESTRNYCAWCVETETFYCDITGNNYDSDCYNSVECNGFTFEESRYNMISYVVDSTGQTTCNFKYDNRRSPMSARVWSGLLGQQDKAFYCEETDKWYSLDLLQWQSAIILLHPRETQCVVYGRPNCDVALPEATMPDVEAALAEDWIPAESLAD